MMNWSDGWGMVGALAAIAAFVLALVGMLVKTSQGNHAFKTWEAGQRAEILGNELQGGRLPSDLSLSSPLTRAGALTAYRQRKYAVRMGDDLDDYTFIRVYRADRLWAWMYFTIGVIFAGRACYPPGSFGLGTFGVILAVPGLILAVLGLYKMATASRRMDRRFPSP